MIRSRTELPAPPTGACEWFALCTNEATATEPHPVLGDVPICERCADKLRRMEATP